MKSQAPVRPRAWRCRRRADKSQTGQPKRQSADGSDPPATAPRTSSLSAELGDLCGDAGGVLPAQAGVSRASSSIPRANPGSPRAGGGQPSLNQLSRSLEMFSPRRRGSAVPADHRHHTAGVLPAQAGVSRRRVRGPRRRRRSPCAGGGQPCMSCDRSEGRVFSPHRRGQLPSLGRLWRAARAGSPCTGRCCPEGSAAASPQGRPINPYRVSSRCSRACAITEGRSLPIAISARVTRPPGSVRRAGRGARRIGRGGDRRPQALHRVPPPAEPGLRAIPSGAPG